MTDIYGNKETLPVVRRTIYRAQNDNSLLLYNYNFALPSGVKRAWLFKGQTRNDWLHLPRMITSEHSMHLKQVHPSESLPLTMPFYPRTSISSLKILTTPNELYVFVKYLKTERKLQNLQIFYILRSFLSDLSKINTNVVILYLQKFVQFLYQLMYCC